MIVYFFYFLVIKIIDIVIFFARCKIEIFVKWIVFNFPLFPLFCLSFFFFFYFHRFGNFSSSLQMSISLYCISNRTFKRIPEYILISEFNISYWVCAFIISWIWTSIIIRMLSIAIFLIILVVLIWFHICHYFLECYFIFLLLYNVFNPWILYLFYFIMFLKISKNRIFF